MICQIIQRNFGKCNNFVYKEIKEIVRYHSFFGKCEAYEIEYFYKNDRTRFKLLKEKTLEEVKSMQQEINVMRNKIEEYDSEIRENLRFLKNIENEVYVKNNETGSK